MRKRGERVRLLYRDRWDCDPETGHEDSMNCWCKPILAHVNRHGDPIIIHRHEPGFVPDMDMVLDMIIAQEDALAEQEEDEGDDDDGEVVRE